MIGHLIARKFNTLWITVRFCRNWLRVSLARYGIAFRRTGVTHRNGVTIRPHFGVRQAWGTIFEPMLADVYGIRRQALVDVVVDVGACIGAFSALAARTHPSARVIAFEPNPTALPALRANLERNGIRSVEVVERPLAATVREVTFAEAGAGGGASSFVQPGGNPRTMTTTTLGAIDWMGARRAFIKLDCEGAEGEIIEWICGNRSRLPAAVALACEYHPWCPVPIEASIRRLEQAGYIAERVMKFDEEYLFATND